MTKVTNSNMAPMKNQQQKCKMKQKEKQNREVQNIPDGIVIVQKIIMK